MSIRQNSPVILNSFQDPCEVARPRHSVAFGSRRACTLKQGQHDGKEHSEHGFTPLKRSAEHGFTGLRRSAEHGFTLVELMVVIVILGLLATIVAINVIPQGDKAKLVRAKSDIATIEGALDLYKLQNDIYPTTAQGLEALVSPPAGSDATKYQRGGYIKKLPVDPWSRPYLYASPGTHGAIDIWTYGADGKEGGEGGDADVTSWQ
jgi:general secretion pathway protein G